MTARAFWMRRHDLEPVADDARVQHQPLHVGRTHARHAVDVEVVERRVVPLPALEDGEPRKPCLGPVEDQLGEPLLVVAHRHTPFFVVVARQQLVVVGPITAAALLS